MQYIIIDGKHRIIKETISASEMIRRIMDDKPIQPDVIVEIFNIKIRKLAPAKFDKLFVNP